jgi:hypothetical protein
VPRADRAALALPRTHHRLSAPARSRRLTLLLVPPTALAVDYVRSHVRAAYWPTPRQILMEIDRGLDKPRRPFRWRELFDWQAFAPRVAPPSRRSTSRSGRRQSGAEAFAQAMGAEGYERPRPASAPWEHVRRNSTANATGTAASTGAAAHEGDGGGGVRGGDDLAKLLLRREQLAFEASIEAILQEERGAKQPKPKRAKPRTRAFRGGAPMPAALGAAYDGWFWLVDQLALLLPPPAQVGAAHRAQRMHPLLLHFEDRSLEDSYMVSFVAGNYRLYTFSMAAWILIIAVHLGVGVAVPLTEGVALSRNGILTLLALAGMMGFFACYIAWLRLSALPRRHFEALNAITTVLIGYGLLFALSQARALVMLVFPVIAHVVCGVRWKYLVCIVLPHHPVFVGARAAPPRADSRRPTARAPCPSRKRALAGASGVARHAALALACSRHRIAARRSRPPLRPGRARAQGSRRLARGGARSCSLSIG